MRLMNVLLKGIRGMVRDVGRRHSGIFVVYVRWGRRPLIFMLFLLFCRRN